MMNVIYGKYKSKDRRMLKKYKLLGFSFRKIVSCIINTSSRDSIGGGEGGHRRSLRSIQK
jgi:hypothetical protein